MWQARSGQIRVRKIAGSACVLSVEKVAVGPFEVECVTQRLAHPDIAKYRAPCVHHEGLHTGGHAMLDQFFFQPATADGVNVVGLSPCFGLVFFAIVNVAGFERKADGRCVSEVVGADEVKVIESALDCQIMAPVVGHTLLLDIASCLEAFDTVRPTAKRWVQRSAGEVTVLPVMVWQDGQLSNDQRQLPVARFFKGKAHAVFGQCFCFFYCLIVKPVARTASFDQGRKRPGDVRGGDRLAVVPARLGAQVEDDP